MREAEEAGMSRLLACLIVFAIASPAFGGDKNWGDKQTRGNKPSVTVQSKTKLHEKEGKLGLEKTKIDAMKTE
jgi:hypothetical protein